MLVEDTGVICIQMFIVFISKTTAAKVCFAFLLKIVGHFVDIQIFFRSKNFYVDNARCQTTILVTVACLLG